ncbi:MAG: LysM peptidoglycan-binding domain-containing protein, partial [Rhodobacteraceae bacterium]|nr:LysM peptidoglycan-binding domain-containing protein [Paracoccaceae bacterium]
QGDGGVRVLDRAPSVLDNVVIDSISYSGAGDVQIAGRAAHSAPEANLRIYLDNRPIAVTRADSGDWTSDLPSVDPGVYTLRVDQLNDAGGVVSRFETPFQREAPEVVAAARAGNEPNAQTAATPDPTAPLAPAADAAPAQAPRAALITVQPGNTLWAISQARYGAGERYVVIYNANRSQIRDPDLIYPGQVFALPDE